MVKRKTNNLDKVIKDLKERNDKLESQRRQFEINLYNASFENNRLKEQIKQLEKELAHKDKIIADLRKLKDRD